MSNQVGSTTTNTSNQIGTPPNRIITQVNAPALSSAQQFGPKTSTSSQQFGGPPDTTDHQTVGIQTHEVTDLDEDSIEYFREMQHLNKVMIHQLMDDRKQLDQHLHSTRIKMLQRLGEMIQDMQLGYARQQSLPDMNYLNQIQQIQERFIQKLASENASILIPIQQMFK